MAFSGRYVVYASIVVPVRLTIAADTEEQTRTRAEEGSWHDVSPDYDKAKLLSIASIGKRT